MHLVGRAEDVGVVLLKAPHARQPVQRAAVLIPAHTTAVSRSAEFSVLRPGGTLEQSRCPPQGSRHLMVQQPLLQCPDIW